jgi:hypothetical protein
MVVSVRARTVSMKRLLSYTTSLGSIRAQKPSFANSRVLCAMKVVVVGGGVFALSAAVALAARGHQVQLLDCNEHSIAKYSRLLRALRAVVAQSIHLFFLYHRSSNDLNRIVRMDYGSDQFFAKLAKRALDAWPAFHNDAIGTAFISLAPHMFSYFLLTASGHTLYYPDGVLLATARKLEEGGYESDSLATVVSLGAKVERLSAASGTNLES